MEANGGELKIDIEHINHSALTINNIYLQMTQGWVWTTISLLLCYYSPSFSVHLIEIIFHVPL